MIVKIITGLISSLLFLSAHAAEQPAYHSSYGGQEKRAVKSLSEDDIQQLSQGKGWGLAKAAELNGMPGPAHLLQMKDKIELNAQQEQLITQLYENMKTKAIPLGKQLIKLEKELNDSFANGTITQASLAQQLNAISQTHKELRYVHLAAHLEISKILTQAQIDKYNDLRGYAKGDPCNNIPQSHDAEMWKKHNGCS